MSKTSKKRKGLSIRITFMLIGILPLLLGIVVTAISSTLTMVNEIKDGIRNELEVAADQVAAYFAYDIIANGVVDYDEYSDHEYMESLQSKDIELTLFKDNKRFLTSIKNEDGEYNEGTEVADNIYDYVKDGKVYSAENVKIADEKYFVVYVPIYDGDGNFWGMGFAGEPERKLTNAIKSVLIRSVSIAAGMIVAFSVIVSIIGILLSKTIKSTTAELNGLSEGDLAVDFHSNSIIKEFSELLDAGNLLQTKLKESIGESKNTADKLAITATLVDDLSKTSSNGAEQISQAINEMASTAQSMAETVQDANCTVAEIGQSIDRISERLADMNNSSEVSISANKVAMEYMHKLTVASEKSSKTVDEISQKIAECSDAATNIKAATDAITEISSRTNLLSLNASIEAARAGESGSGFAVVAGEIQKLAEQSNNSAIEIQNVIDEILKKVNDCVDKAQEMNVVIDEQMKFLEDAKTKIDAMSIAGDELANGAEKIGTEAETLIRLKDSVMSNVSDLSAISEENAASSEEVAASIESIAGAVESTRTESENMKTLAEDLDEKMKYFKIDTNK